MPTLAIKTSALAVMLAFAGGVGAEELSDSVLRLIKPESSVTLGFGQVSNDSQRFGMYNGLHDHGAYGIGEFSLIKRDDATGTWFRAQGRNLGLPEAELRVEHERQGHWQYFAEFDQTTRYSPYTVYSNLQGAGSNYLSYPATTGAQPQSTNKLSDLKTERLGTKLGFNHYFNNEFGIRVLFQNVEKQGERLFGRGTPSVQEFLVEPINSVTRQLDAVLDYTGEKLQLSGGYYGSWYQNNNNQLNIDGGDSGLRNAAGPNALPLSIISLPPDNFAHQFHLAGSYKFTDSTRGNFKLSRSYAYQEDSFVTVPAPTSGTLPTGGLNRSGRTDLGGKLETTLVKLGVSSRPTRNLSLLGNLRYEDRHDTTKVAQYINVSGASSSTDGFNEPRSLTISSGKFEASYQLPAGYRLTGGIDLEQKKRSTAGVRVVGYRERTEEITYRVELKKSLSETLNGAVAYLHSDRNGSDFQDLATWNPTTGQFNSPTTYSNRVQPIYLSDRSRDKIRLLSDWTPLEPLNLQFVFETSSDTYGAGRDVLDIGPRQGKAWLYSLDASWTLTDNWRLNAWMSRNETSMEQATGSSTATLWNTDMVNRTQMVGIGIKGKLTALIDVGADAMISRDRSIFNQGGAAAASPLPDINYDQTTLKLFGRYAMTKDSSIRLDYIRDQRKTDDWTWTGTDASGPYVYTDGTTLYQNPNQTVHFLGVSLRYTFR